MNDEDDDMEVAVLANSSARGSNAKMYYLFPRAIYVFVRLNCFNIL